MGNTKSCESIQPRINRACDIGKCAKSIRGYASNSASPTDIWELEMYDGVRYGQEKIPNKIILKLYIDNISPGLKRKIKTIYKNMVEENREVVNSKELRYESDIYNYVIGLFTRENINPYFVRYYGASQECTFDQLVKSVTVENSPDRKMTKLRIPKKKFIENLVNNTLFMAGNKSKRPSINNLNPVTTKENIKSIIQDLNNPLDRIKYGMIITEKSNGEVFGNWFETQIRGGEISDDGWKSIVQVLSALTALETLEVAHNDLHLGNIFVEDLNGEVLEQFKYTYNDKELAFGIRSNFRCAIYDWDRGYMQKLGNNPTLEENKDSLCDITSQCNEYIAQREVTKFLIYILNYNINNIEREKIYTCMMGMNYNQINFFHKNIVKGNYFLQLNQNQALKRKHYEQLGIFTPTKVLTNLLILLQNNRNIIEFTATDESHYNKNSVIYDMTRNTVQNKFNNYYRKKDFKQMEIFENDK